MPQNHSQQTNTSLVLFYLKEESADFHNPGLVITAGKLRKRSDITLQVSSTDFSKQKYYTTKLCPLSLLSTGCSLHPSCPGYLQLHRGEL